MTELSSKQNALFSNSLAGQLPAADDIPLLADIPLSAALLNTAKTLASAQHHNVITYSRKVFFPLTHLCRDVCHYCTFAQTPKKIESPFMPMEEVLAQARVAASMGCKEALFTLGEKPELRYKAAREALNELGYASTLHYLKAVAEAVFRETGILPHLNPGCMNADEIAMLRPVAASMGIMLESGSERLCEKGMPHYGSPDKQPAVRLATLEEAGKQKVPFTTGILIGIGETRRERIESLFAIRDIHQRHGHIQEIIIQNFRAKPGTKMVNAPEPDLDELLWTIAIARLVFGESMSIQAPPNLSPGVLPKIIEAGINDWGGVSPVTPDFVNPEAPWPHLEKLARETGLAGKYLQERLTLYPAYVREMTSWADPAFHQRMLELQDTEGLARQDNWYTGSSQHIPEFEAKLVTTAIKNSKNVSADIVEITRSALHGEALTESAICRLFSARGDDFAYVCQQADQLRKQLNGDTVTYTVNRNINYTNICYFKCRFCAFSKGKASEELRGKPYNIDYHEIQRRAIEAWDRGAGEVCLQGGIHPDYDGSHYINVCRCIKQALPDIHIHAFSPLEIWQGAETLGISLESFLLQLKDAGLGTLPGTAAEILDDEIRQVICPDKINTAQWLEVMKSAHQVGFRTTSTIMFGHVERYEHWARHLLAIRQLQAQTGGFTEFVPLPFVAEEAPMFKRGIARKGPSYRECVLMHAVARLVFGKLLPNIQASWVKLGKEGVSICLNAGVNDLGGTLMNESITRAAGATHGQEFSPEYLEALITGAGRLPRQRTTLYTDRDPGSVARSFNAAPLSDIINNNDWQAGELLAVSS